MTYKTCDLVMVDGQWVQQERDCTPDEVAEIEARKAAAAGEYEAQLIRHFDGLVQKSIDDGARSLGYGDPNRPEVSPILHAVGYAEEPAVVKYQAEGRLLRAFRSLRWYRSLTILQEVKSGERPIPTDAELLADLDEHAPVPTQEDVEAEIARLTAP